MLGLTTAGAEALFSWGRLTRPWKGRSSTVRWRLWLERKGTNVEHDATVGMGFVEMADSAGNITAEVGIFRLRMPIRVAHRHASLKMTFW